MCVYDGGNVAEKRQMVGTYAANDAVPFYENNAPYDVGARFTSPPRPHIDLRIGMVMRIGVVTTGL
jgi:hypothetical protein